MRTRLELQELQTIIYQYHLRGLNSTEIARAIAERQSPILISRSQVFRHLQKIRAENTRWFDKHYDPSQRRRRLWKENIDGTMLVLREAWRNYSASFKPANDETTPASLMVRNQLLNTVLKVYTTIRDTMGLTAQDVDEYAYVKQVEQLQAELDRIKDELSQSKKITPLQRGTSKD